MTILFRILFLIFAGTIMSAQSSTEQWEVYLASYEDGKPGSTTVRMDLINQAPMKEFPVVLVTGVTYETKREDGFPEPDTYGTLAEIGDKLVALISMEAHAIVVGSFMFQSERLEYFYVQDDSGLKEKIEAFYQENYPEYKFYLNSTEDAEWSYYKEFLYPNEQTLSYMADQAVVRQLEEAGDPLTKARNVDHWLYFTSKADRKRCKDELITQGFSCQTQAKNKNAEFPFPLIISRVDKVDIDSIYPITTSLKQTAKKHKGVYDGWETSVEKE